jgi:hypothetical protein
MRHGNWLIVAMAAIVLPACELVESTVPMGFEPVAVSEEDWDGLWLGDEGVVAITVTDEEAGELTASFLFRASRSATPPHELDNYHVIVRRSGDWLFANTHYEDSSDWLWMRVKLEGDQLIAWAPDPSAISALVSRGLLPGTIDDSGGGERIILDPLTPAQDELIRSGSEGMLMAWDDPMVLMRIRRSVGVPR